MKRQALLLFSTLILLAGCSPQETTSGTSSNGSNESSDSEISSSDHNNESSESSSSSEGGSSSTGEEKIYYKLSMNFDSRIDRTTGLKQNYQKGATVTFSVEYDHEEVTNVKVLLNNEELSPISEDCYSFTMPGKDSTLIITAEDTIKKYSVSKNAPNAEIVFEELTNLNALLEGTEVKFRVVANSDYGIASVNVTYLGADNTTSQAKLTLTNNVYSFVMPAADVSINVETDELHTVFFPASINTGFGIQYVDGSSAKAISGSIVSFKITQNDPSSLFKSVSVYSSYDYSSQTGSNPINCSSSNDVYSFVMPNKAVYIIVNFEKRYSITIQKDDNISSITIDNAKEYYSNNEDVTFSIAYKEGYKRDKIQVKKSSDNSTVELNSIGTNQYSFKIPADNVVIVATSKSESETSYWETRTIYYYEMPRYNSNDQKYLEEIIVYPDTERVDINVYQNTYDSGGYEDYSIELPSMKRAVSTDPSWWSDSDWTKMNKGVSNAPYSFDKVTNKMTVVDGDETYTLAFNIESEEAVSLTIDKAVNNDFTESIGQTFMRWSN